MMETYAEFRAFMRGWAHGQHSITEGELYKVAHETAHKVEVLREGSFRRTSAEIEATVTQIMREYQ